MTKKIILGVIVGAVLLGTILTMTLDNNNVEAKKPLFLSRDGILSNLEAVTTLFLFMGVICIGTYLVPVFLEKLDDWKKGIEIAKQ